MKKTALLSEVTEEKSGDHGCETDPAQLFRRHFKDLSEPALHGFGGRRIRQAFEDEDETYQGKQKFHAPPIPESSICCNMRQRY